VPETTQFSNHFLEDLDRIEWLSKNLFKENNDSGVVIKDSSF